MQGLVVSPKLGMSALAQRTNALQQTASVFVSLEMHCLYLSATGQTHANRRCTFFVSEGVVRRL